MIMIESQKLGFDYPDGTKALEEVSMKIEAGKITAILGGNGAGKSTLFLTLNGILKPTSGKLYYKGNVIAYNHKQVKALREWIGIVFQDPDQQLFCASVYEDVSFGVVNQGLPESIIRVKVEEALKKVGAWELRHRPTHSLSFGQKKRVAIAGVLAMAPDVLILDEPTAGLDPKGVGEMMALIQKLKQDLGVAVVIATHDMDIIPLYCDYAYVLDRGRIVIEGTPEVIFEKSERLRAVGLRLPRIGHLMEILKSKDGLVIEGMPYTIGSARRAIKKIVEDKNDTNT